MKKSRWVIYLLYNPRMRMTYIGATVDPIRRLAQHNGLLKGGAKATHAGIPDWELVAYVGIFVNRSEAYSWEKIMKKKAVGLRNRYNILLNLSNGILPPRYTTPPKNKLTFTRVYDESKIN